jgi:hypothetical protein
MHICFVDESGGFEVPGSNPGATPLMAIIGIILDAAHLQPATMNLLQAKAKFYPQKCHHPKFLDNIKAEVKGADVRASLRSPSRNARRHAKGYLDRIVSILQSYNAAMIGRVWIKAVGTALDPDGSYTYAIQDIAKHFQHFLDANSTEGLIVCDGRMHNQNSQVSHSIFTQKHRAIGDPYSRIVDAPVFGSSANHAALQFADTVASGLVFPMAARVYCAHQWTGLHTDPHFDAVRARYASKLQAMQYRYTAPGGWRGGVVVSDRLRGTPSAKLFQ